MLQVKGLERSGQGGGQFGRIHPLALEPVLAAVFYQQQIQFGAAVRCLEVGLVG